MDKVQEHWHLERFRSIYPGFPQGQVTPSEEPDFLITGPTKRVGIELTELLRPAAPGKQSRKEVESLRNRVAREAQAIYEGFGAAHVRVQLHFNESAQLTKARVRPLGEELARLVADLGLGENQRIVLKYGASAGRQLPREINVLSAGRYTPLKRSHWSVPDAGFEHPWTIEEIQSAIDRKARRLPAYRTRCDEVWLLLVVEGYAISSTAHLPQPTREHVFTSPFDRVVYFDNLDKTYYELIGRR